MACRIIWTNQINCLDRRLNRLLSRRHPQGFLFRSTESIKKDHPEVPAFEEYDELLEAIKKSLYRDFFIPIIPCAK